MGPLVASMMPGLVSPPTPPTLSPPASPTAEDKTGESNEENENEADSAGSASNGGDATRGILPTLLDASDTACALAVPICSLIGVIDARGIVR